MKFNSNIEFNPFQTSVQIPENFGINAAVEQIVSEQDKTIVVRTNSTRILETIINPLQAQGRQIMLANFQDLEHSFQYNPLYGLTADDTEQIRTVAKMLIEGAYSQSVLPAAIDFLTFAIMYMIEFISEDSRNITSLYKLAQMNLSDEGASNSHTLLETMKNVAIKRNPHAKCFALWDAWYDGYSACEKADGASQIIQRLAWTNISLYHDLCTTAYNAQRNTRGEIIEYNKDEETQGFKLESNNILTRNQKGNVIYILENEDIATPDMYEYAYDFRQMVLRMLNVRLAFEQPETLMIIHQDKQVYMIAHADWKNYGAMSNSPRDISLLPMIKKVNVKSNFKPEKHLATQFIEQITITNPKQADRYCVNASDEDITMHKHCRTHTDDDTMQTGENVHECITEREAKPVKMSTERVSLRKPVKTITDRASLVQAILPEQYPLDLLDGSAKERARALRNELDKIFLQAFGEDTDALTDEWEIHVKAKSVILDNNPNQASQFLTKPATETDESDTNEDTSWFYR